MHNLHSLVFLATAALINAQSAPDFPIQVGTNLEVEYQSSSTDVSPAGVLLDQSAVSGEPTIIGPEGSSRTIDYMVFIVDQDVTAPSTGTTRVQFLHWYQPNLSGASEVLFMSGADTTNFTSANPLTYVPPQPPAGDIAHRYTILMYLQPKGFSIPSQYQSVFEDKSDLSNRLNFDIKGFLSASGLGDAVAANWFEVQNTTAAATTSAVSSQASTTSASTTSSTSTTEASTTTTETASTTESSSTTSDSTTVSTEQNTSTTFATTTPQEPSTSTAVVFATPSDSTPTPASPSSSSATTSSLIAPNTGSGAGCVDVRSSLGGLTVGLTLSLAGFWLL